MIKSKTMYVQISHRCRTYKSEIHTSQISSNILR